MCSCEDDEILNVLTECLKSTDRLARGAFTRPFRLENKLYDW